MRKEPKMTWRTRVSESAIRPLSSCTPITVQTTWALSDPNGSSAEPSSISSPGLVETSSKTDVGTGNWMCKTCDGWSPSWNNRAMSFSRLTGCESIQCRHRCSLAAILRQVSAGLSWPCDFGQRIWFCVELPARSQEQPAKCRRAPCDCHGSGLAATKLRNRRKETGFILSTRNG